MDHSSEKDTAPIRPGEELNARSLEEYLRDRLPDAGSGIALEQFPGGHSNLTYLVRAGGTEYVLRRAPLGPVAPKAHDMAREYKVLAAVHPHFPPAPEPFLLCEDTSIIGAVFYLMERRRGIVLRGDVPPDWAANPALPQLISKAFLDCLIQLH
jgi:aminoglycoside phosphotransferase (APT) family kinase protein